MQAAFDYRLDGALNEACAEEVNENCSEKIPGEGRVLRCLVNLSLAQGGQCVKIFNCNCLAGKPCLIALPPVLY